MKNRLSLAAAIAAVSFAANAADLPNRKALPPLPVPIPALLDAWSGPYIGIGAGGVFPVSSSFNAEAYQTGYEITNAGTFKAAYTPYSWTSGATFNTNVGGFLGAMIGGWNWRLGFNNNMIVGVEGEFAIPVGANNRVTYAVPGQLFGLGVTPQVAEIGRSWKWGATFGPRVGYLIFNDMLLYVNGGVAFVQSPQAITFGSAAALVEGTSSNDHTRVGWFIGGGAEWQFAPGWRAGISYKYVGLPNSTVSTTGLAYGAPYTPFPGCPTMTPNAATTYIASGNPSAHIVQVRLTRSLDFWSIPSPIVQAKY